MHISRSHHETRMSHEGGTAGFSDLPIRLATPQGKRVVFIDSDDIFLKKTTYRLKQAGFLNIAAFSRLADRPHALFDDADLVIADVSPAANFDTLFSAFELAKFRGYRGLLVLVSEEATCNAIYSAAILGVSDFWIKGPHLKIDREVTCILSRKPGAEKEKLCPETVANLGFFRSVGLTEGEIALIAQLADGFPRQCEIASRLNRSSAYIHKMFSRIYEKLTVAVDVDNPAQLAFLITVCSMFR